MNLCPVINIPGVKQGQYLRDWSSQLRGWSVIVVDDVYWWSIGDGAPVLHLLNAKISQLNIQEF